MAVALSIFGVVFAAFCVWLGVRVYNRRERWAKRTLAAIIGPPLLYLLSTGPLIWLSMQDRLPDGVQKPTEWYLWPLFCAIIDSPPILQVPLLWWIMLWGWHE